MNKFEEEIAKSTAETLKNVAEDTVRPTSKAIGRTIGTLAEGIFGWVALFGEMQLEKQKLILDNYKRSINKKIEEIPKENLVEPKLHIIGPALESSKFYYEEEHYRELFGNLIASACDKTKNNKVHVSFSSIIKELSPLDAKFLSMFKGNNVYPMASIMSRDKEGSITPYLIDFFNFNDLDNKFDLIEKFDLTSSLDNLIRLGLVVKRNDILVHWDYNNFKKDKIYQAIESKEKNEIEIKKYRIELTAHGRNFLHVCL